jgi:hypothetical protein
MLGICSGDHAFTHKYFEGWLSGYGFSSTFCFPWLHPSAVDADVAMAIAYARYDVCSIVDRHVTSHSSRVWACGAMTCSFAVEG